MISMTKVIQEIRDNANMMPREKGITLPMISIEHNAVIVRCLIYFTRIVPNEGTHITAPQYVSTYDLTNGKFINMKQYLNLDLSVTEKSPWIHNRPIFKDANDIIPEFDRIWSLYDILISYYINKKPVDTKINNATLEFMQLFKKHAEIPLSPYYRYHSGKFLDWIKEVARENRS